MKENEASATAYAVLQGLLYVGRKPRYKGLVADDVLTAGQTILAATEEGRKRLRQLDSALFRTIVPLMETLLVPGLTLHYALRKRFIEDAVLSAIEAEGVTQVVNLGAGFDTLAWRLHERFPEVNFIEIDHPATGAAKAQALGERMAAAEKLHQLSVDFTRQTLAARLGGFSGFQPERTTLYICEGVMAYLTEEQVTEMLETLVTLSQGAAPWLVCTCVEPLEAPENNTGPLLGTYLRMKGESIHWRIAHGTIKGFLADRGYEMMDLGTVTEFKTRYLSGIDHGVTHGGEYGVLARARQ
ncbi:MAG: class I SAM-dependent methyltransferase [Pseudomonadota bacterium]|nr:class I SAM-dependent methyltransferase [Pseudomonadota bacterium]MEC9420965.1 class I SAM-dependent methyltransferase [Pseudomonadota bacterium]MEE2866268.1 class I SAM-dependent methyltransferase [Pseudomonadota bacterium]